MQTRLISLKHDISHSCHCVNFVFAQSVTWSHCCCIQLIVNRTRIGRMVSDETNQIEFDIICKTESMMASEGEIHFPKRLSKNL